jgi:ATP-binding cassette subfamily B protein
VTPIISAIILGIFILNSLIGWRLIKINIQRRIAFNAAEDRVSGVITDNLINYETVKFFAKETKEESRLLNEFKDWKIKIWGYANSFRFIDITIGTVSNIGILLILLIVLNMLINGEAGVGDLVLVVSFTNSFFHRFFQLIYQVRNIAKHYADIETYFAILDNEILIQDPQKPKILKKVMGEVELRNASFAYPDNADKVLDNINLSVPQGTSVAFVGRSGAGKTTLIKLLLRFYDVTEGEILIDGVNIKDFTKSQLRSFIGIVPQEPILFNNTIGYNIAYGNDKARKMDIIQSAKMANLHDFIESLPQKYETQVGERGIKLSGGQKQRLAIARMILSNPRIIVFDEATSNLDSESERLIQASLKKISQDRTVLIVAHRFSTVRNVDKIIVLENGRIKEEGTHQSLIRRKESLYHYLWRLQTSHQKLSPMVNFLR